MTDYEANRDRARDIFRRIDALRVGGRSAYSPDMTPEFLARNASRAVIEEFDRIASHLESLLRAAHDPEGK